MSFPVQDLSQWTPRLNEDAKFSCNIDNIDCISTILRILWKYEKNQLWASEVTFTGFIWNLANKTIALSVIKWAKYLTTIEDWHTSHMHTLKEVQKLYRKLVHASLIIWAGYAYLTNLELMLEIFQNIPFKSCISPAATIDDLKWWHSFFSSPSFIRSIVDPLTFFDI